MTTLGRSGGTRLALSDHRIALAATVIAMIVVFVGALGNCLDPETGTMPDTVLGGAAVSWWLVGGERWSLARAALIRGGVRPIFFQEKSLLGPAQPEVIFDPEEGVGTPDWTDNPCRGLVAGGSGRCGPQGARFCVGFWFSMKPRRA